MAAMFIRMFRLFQAFHKTMSGHLRRPSSDDSTELVGIVGSCLRQRARSYSRSRNCRRQLTRRANAHNTLPSGFRVCACCNDGARRQDAVGLVPREQPGDSHHKQDASEVDRKLHEDVAAQRGQQDMAEHREKDTETEYLQRVLAAPDDQLSNTAA